MDELDSADTLLFEGFRLDCRGGALYRFDQAGTAPVALGSRALGLLGLLAARRGEVLSKDAIIKAVWPGRVVEEANLNVQISKLRRILDQNRGDGSCIQTLPGHGYCFVAPVTRPDADAQPAVPTISQGGAHPRPHLSIVVLPFANLSEDRTQQYFADGITEDLTTDLSRIAGMFVISRNTAFTYRDKPVDTKQIGHELGVRYVLEGSVRRSGNQVRVNIQLIDSETDTHLWADRFDRDRGDLFALQNEITTQIAVTLNLELVVAEAARSTDNPDALDYVFRARAATWGTTPSGEGHAEAIDLLERALALDPGSVDAQCWLAIRLANQALDFPGGASDGDIKRAEELATKAVVASPRSSLAHFAKAQALRVQNRCDEAIPEYETVLALTPNWVGAIFSIAWCRFHLGSVEEMIPALEQVIRLSPRDPYIGLWYARMGIVHLLQSRTDEAIVWLEKGRSAIPARHYTRANLAAAYALRGETERAAAELAEARRLSRANRYSSIAREKVEYFGVPIVRALYEATYFAGLRKAGMPENEPRLSHRQRLGDARGDEEPDRFSDRPIKRNGLIG
jgi:TolB-like protein